MTCGEGFSACWCWPKRGAEGRRWLWSVPVVVTPLYKLSPLSAVQLHTYISTGLQLWCRSVRNCWDDNNELSKTSCQVLVLLCAAASIQVVVHTWDPIKYFEVATNTDSNVITCSILCHLTWFINKSASVVVTSWNSSVGNQRGRANISIFSIQSIEPKMTLMDNPN